MYVLYFTSNLMYIQCYLTKILPFKLENLTQLKTWLCPLKEGGQRWSGEQGRLTGPCVSWEPDSKLTTGEQSASLKQRMHHTASMQSLASKIMYLTPPTGSQPSLWARAEATFQILWSHRCVSIGKDTWHRLMS